MTRKRKLLAALAAVIAAVVVTGGVIATAAASSRSGNQLAGTWTVSLNRPAPLPPLASLQVYTGEGSMVESGNDSASRSPQYGSWRRVAGRNFAATGVFFRFDPQTGRSSARRRSTARSSCRPTVRGSRSRAARRSTTRTATPRRPSR